MTMTDVTFRVGDKVLVDGPKYGGIWTIVKVNQKTYGLTQGVRRLRCAPEFMRPVGDASDGNARPLPAPMAARTMPLQREGALVRYIGRDGKHVKHGTLMVVIADKYDKVNVALVGGFPDGGYVRSPWQFLEAVDPTAWVVVED